MYSTLPVILSEPVICCISNISSPNLFEPDEYITEEEIWACTSCNACVQECPVNIDPLSIIVDLRRYLVMEESKMPTELAGMLTNIENNGAPWQFSPNDRLNWANEE